MRAIATALALVLLASGAYASERPASPPKSPMAAGVFSFLLPGTGQFYNGELLKGVAFLGATVAGIAMAEIGEGGTGPDDFEPRPVLEAAGIVFVVATYGMSVVDAYRSAKRINRERGWALHVEPNRVAIALRF